MSTVRIHGASLTDTMFTTDAAIFGVEIMWNVTRIQRDADAGVFGKPETIPMAALPPMSSLANANVDWDKVRGMVRAHDLNPEGSAINTPALQVMVDMSGTLYRLPVDGNHRICARRIIGYGTFKSYVVPTALEARYRITEEIVR